MLSQETQCFGDDYIGLMILFMALKFRKNYVGNCKTHLSLTIYAQDMANKTEWIYSVMVGTFPF